MNPVRSAPHAENRRRSASETRILDLALQRYPLPSLTKGAIEERWRSDTVRKILRDFGVAPGGTKDVKVPLTDILPCEGIADPLRVWFSTNSAGRKILTADLPKLDEWRALILGETARDPTRYYHLSSDEQLPSIRIGKLHRFRLTIDAVQRRLASCRGAES